MAVRINADFPAPLGPCRTTLCFLFCFLHDERGRNRI